MSSRVLVAGGAREGRRYLQGLLGAEGLQVRTAAEPSDEDLAAPVPDLVLADDGDAPGSALALLARLRARPTTAAVPVVLVGGAAARPALALAAGADDALPAPYDAFELVARVRALLRRTADALAASPLTGLPGNHRIDAEVAARAARGRPYAVCHVDLDEFKSFNDAYGFSRGDEVLLLAARELQAAAAATAGPPPFVGHVGGDDFVVVCAPEQAEPLCARAVAGFDAAVAGLYDPADAERGWLDVVDRRGTRRRHPLVAVSVGIAVSDGAPRDRRAVVAAASEMKGVAKSTAGSALAVDRRS